MHEELIERRLRTALQDEASSLPFTITAAEMERRMTLRRRAFAGRRLPLLLAAAVGIGLVGVGGALSGMFTTSLPTPTASVTAPNGPEPSRTVSEALPSLDELLAAAPSGTVALAQAHGPGDGPAALPSGADLGGVTVNLGSFAGSTEFEATIACRGASTMQFTVARFVDTPSPASQITCDGSIQTARASDAENRAMLLSASEHASWRIVIRRIDGAAPPPVADPPELDPGPGYEDLVELEDWSIEANSPALEASGLLFQEVGNVPARERYRFALWCADTAAVRYIHGDLSDRTFVASTTTQLACDGSVHIGVLSFLEPSGRVFVAATPGARVSLLVFDTPPPVAVVSQEPGWQLSSGFGPGFAFDTSSHWFTGSGVEGGGPIMVVLACVGTDPIEVTVDLGKVSGQRLETFTADCTREGSTTGQSFLADGSYSDVTYTAPGGSWTALSILVPDPRRVAN